MCSSQQPFCAKDLTFSQEPYSLKGISQIQLRYEGIVHLMLSRNTVMLILGESQVNGLPIFQVKRTE